MIVENQVLLPAHDIQYEVGQYAADSYQFFIPVTDGRLDVRLVSRTKKKPVINALRVARSLIAESPGVQCASGRSGTSSRCRCVRRSLCPRLPPPGWRTVDVHPGRFDAGLST